MRSLKKIFYRHINFHQPWKFQRNLPPAVFIRYRPLSYKEDVQAKCKLHVHWATFLAKPPRNPTNQKWSFKHHENVLQSLRSTPKDFHHFAIHLTIVHNIKNPSENCRKYLRMENVSSSLFIFTSLRIMMLNISLPSLGLIQFSAECFSPLFVRPLSIVSKIVSQL